MQNNSEVDQVISILSQFDEIRQQLPITSYKQIKKPTKSFETNKLKWFVDPTRLNEIRNIQSEYFDLSKIIRYCEEINICWKNECFLAIPMLGRAILDHIPPIFKCKSFTEVANNFSGGTKSFGQSMEHLENSTRKIADAHLHVQIRKSEILPNSTQVNFSADLDVLLSEIVRLLKSS